MMRDNNKLDELTDTNSPAETLAEIKNILLLIDPSLEPSPIEKVFEDIVRLFNGEFPGYKANNTKYHNLEHTCSSTLASARLIHGLQVQGQFFSPRLVQLCLIGALFHDTGLIQTEEEVGYRSPAHHGPRGSLNSPHGKISRRKWLFAGGHPRLRPYYKVYRTLLSYG